MTRTWIALAGLLVLVAALAAWVHLQPERSAAAREHALSDVDPAAVHTMRYEPRSEPPLVLERGNGGGWRISAPFTARADTFHVEWLLGILTARASARYPADDLARFELDAPRARLTIEAQAFAFGGINAMTREQYVLTRGRVYTVPIVFVRLPRSADTLIARELFAPADSPVRFELPEFSMALAEGRWTLSPGEFEASADERNAWVDRWRHAAALHATRAQSVAPPQTIIVHLADGRRIVLGIAERQPELVLVRGDEGIQYHFSAEAARRLLEPPGGRPQRPAGVR